MPGYGAESLRFCFPKILISVIGWEGTAKLEPADIQHLLRVLKSRVEKRENASSALH